MNDTLTATAPSAMPPETRPGPEVPVGPRYFHLDAVRAFALLLGVLFHAAESFGPDNQYWAIVDCSPSRLLEDIRFACHSFRLELFFIIAGFFARLLLLRRGFRGFVGNRAVRILVPFAVGWLVLYPVLVYLWIWGRSVSGNWGDMQLPPEARNFAAWQVWLGFFITLGFLKSFDMTHLWFLHQLLALYVIMLAFRAGLHRTGATARVMPGVDKLFGRIVCSPLAILVFSVAAFPLLLLMKSWGVDTPKESLIPELAPTLLFGYCFLAGWLFHRQPGLIEVLGRRWVAHLAFGIVLWCSFSLFDEHAIRQMTPPERWRIRLLFTLQYAHMMWAFVLGFLGLFTRVCSQASAWSRYLADSSYWIYIVHLPLVVGLQVALGRMRLPWPLKYPLIVLISVVLLYTSYHYFVRGTFIGKLLNGRTYPRAWPWQRPLSPGSSKPRQAEATGPD